MITAFQGIASIRPHVVLPKWKASFGTAIAKKAGIIEIGPFNRLF
jgi:hypothetical protein